MECSLNISNNAKCLNIVIPILKVDHQSWMALYMEDASKQFCRTALKFTARLNGYPDMGFISKYIPLRYGKYEAE